MTKDFCEDCGVKLTDSNRSKAYRNKCKQCVANNERRKRNQRIESSKSESTKSIKEKAIEVFPRHCNANTDYSNFKKRIGFNSGANYVIEQIEQLIYEKHIEGSLPLFDLTHLIDKLKEK